MKASSSTRLLKLDQLVSEGLVSESLLTNIYEEIKTRDILSTAIINLHSELVVQLPTYVVTSREIDGDSDVRVWNYVDWRKEESAKLTNAYDRKRFVRSTDLAILCKKVREHAQYSFISRSSAKDGNCVIKYSFVSLSADGQMILSTRQDITKSLEHDIVTGGLNREGLLRELTHKIKNRPVGVNYSLLCFNIKNFHVINELQGSEAGDLVLQHMYTSIVYSELRPLSYARYESDIFVCLINRDLLDTDVISRLCVQECEVGSHKVIYRSVCGIYHLEDNEVTPVIACAHAKLATTMVKDQFITPWKVYDAAMQREDISVSEILDRIEEAFVQREFEPYYQPVVNLQTGRVEMAEALVRWISPKHGMIPPGKFIPMLERIGGLSRIDKQMEQDVFDLQSRRLSSGQSVVPIDLNLSWTDFADTNFISQVQEHVLDDKVPTDLVRFEITESAYDEIADNRLDVLNFFQTHGVKLAVDDFGQGYSFGTMKNVDFHIVKLDKSLIDKIGQSRKMDLLVKSFIDVFHALNSKIVAEGVETEKQVNFLRSAGCDYVQGYYFFRPMNEEAFLRVLDEQNSQFINDDAPVGMMKYPVPEGDAATQQLQLQLVKAEVALQHHAEENKCFRQLLDELNIHLFEWDVKTHVDVASDSFCRLYSLPSNQLPNMPEVCPLVVEEDRDRFRAFYERITGGEKMGSDNFRLFRPDGKGYAWYRKTFYTLYDDKGMPSKAIITMEDTGDKYQYRILRQRDRMLTQEQEIVTFMYMVSDDTFSFNYPGPNGQVQSVTISNYLNTPVSELTPDQGYLASMIRQRIAEGPRTGSIDFRDIRLNTEFRAHYTMIDGEYGTLYAIIGQAEDINKTRERLEAKERLLRLSQIDGLTQLNNRSAGEQAIISRLESGEPGVFGIMDCDKFKSVNDTYGHVVGDALLVALGKALTETLPEGGVAMRLGGDEFAFCISGSYTKERIVNRVNEFFERISHLEVEGMKDFPVQVSVGAVIYEGGVGQANFDTLYRQADKLLYDSKRYPGNKLSL